MSKKHKSKGHKRSQHKPTIPRYNPHPPQPITEKREISPQEMAGLMEQTYLYILNRDFGFGQERLLRLRSSVKEFWLQENKSNDTVIEELDNWVEKKGLKL